MTPDPPRSSSGSGRGTSPGANVTGEGSRLRRIRSSAIPLSVKSPGLIEAQHFERIDTTSPELRETQQQAKNQSAASALGDQALRMKVRDAIDELLPEQEIEWRDEMHHQRRTAGKEHRIRPPHRAEMLRRAAARSRQPSRPAAPRTSVSCRCGDGCGSTSKRAIAHWFRGLSARLARWSIRPA